MVITLANGVSFVNDGVLIGAVEQALQKATRGVTIEHDQRVCQQ